jgi:hypothetical protein
MPSLSGAGVYAQPLPSLLQLTVPHSVLSPHSIFVPVCGLIQITLWRTTPSGSLPPVPSDEQPVAAIMLPHAASKTPRATLKTPRLLPRLCAMRDNSSYSQGCKRY